MRSKTNILPDKPGVSYKW